MTDFGGQKRASSYLPASNYARQKLVTNSQRITNTRHVFYVAILFLGSIVCMLAWRSPDRPVGQVRTPGTVVREEGTWTTGRSRVTSGGARQGGVRTIDDVWGRPWRGQFFCRMRGGFCSPLGNSLAPCSPLRVTVETLVTQSTTLAPPFTFISWAFDVV
jgi:hypothetical protein